MFIAPEEREHFQEMLRQQLLGDQELMRDAVAGRTDPKSRVQVYDRIQVVRRLADEVGLPAEGVERRHGSRRSYQRRTLQVPPSALWAALWVALSTVAVYTVDHLRGDAIPSLYLPVIAWITLRYGRRVGVIGTLACAALYGGLHPFLTDRQSVTAGIIAFASFLLGNWLIRRDLF